jgi:Na+/melibiose symporter-like transporter
LRSDLADVFTCKPWVVMFLLTLFVFTTLALRGGSFNYYFTYYLDHAKIMTFLESIGLASAAAGDPSWWKSALDAFGLVLKPDGSNAAGVGFSLFNMAGNVVIIAGILSSKTLADRFGKRNVFIIGLGLTTLVTALIVVVPPSAVGAVFLLGALWGLFYGPTVPLLWAMIADVPDYSEWKTGRRATGFAYAGIVFALKAGLGIGGALGGWLLAGYGYVANAAQTEHALRGIRLSASVFSALPFLLGVICLFAYPITRELNQRIQTELDERRKKYAAA